MFKIVYNKMPSHTKIFLNIILVFEEGMQQILKQAYNSKYEDDALLLSKAAKIVHEDILNSNGFQFSGSFFLTVCKVLCKQTLSI